MPETTAAIPSYDLLTLGETLLRLSPPGMQRLDQARLFEIGVGGSELNVGCLLARLGRRGAWGSRPPQGPPGPLVDGRGPRPRGRHPHVRGVARGRPGAVFFSAAPGARNTKGVFDSTQFPP